VRAASTAAYSLIASRSTFAVSFCLLAACGRLGFIGVGDDTSGDDGGVIDAVDGATDRPNRAFVTPDLLQGDFGGLVGADAICASQAAAAGLPGDFIALLSTSTVNAKDRIAGSRGWVRTDGVVLADQARDFFLAGHQLAPLHLDATGVGPPSSLLVWTAAGSDGSYDSTNGACGDWTATTGSAMIGFHNRNTPFATWLTPSPCSQTAHLYCLEIGHAVEVRPPPRTGRIAFVLKVSVANDIGLAGFDAACQAEADAAALPGTYLAAVGTSTQTIESRFAATTPWQRLDGMELTPTAQTMFTMRMTGFLDQYADGFPRTSAIQVTPVRSGGPPNVMPTLAGTCNDWSTTAGTFEAGTMNSIYFTEFWSGQSISCNTPQRHVCLQQ
jgi:hypothetical protein